MSSTDQEKLDAIEEAIGTGALKIKYSDKEITYASLTDLLRARDYLRMKMGKSKGKRIKTPIFSKGL